ncbi:MAG: tRNA (N(6)-L-threonylcarbamoyladenosine(37)-C(2))-methylthiotransferase MtaB, partial [Planctomycetes bacterium]|nr:tRNA (N(6)-L-threonylcarbamoyladenosine(37)-C(2))-methylthiotransferase MtaB [Planctomycetota bacterium]
MFLPKLKTVTLGCKVNQYETQYVREGLLGIGYQDARDDEIADLCVVNTCTVTAEGDKKSRQVIRQLSRRNPGTRIVVMGCYATRAPDEVAALPSVVEVVRDKRELPDLLGRFGVIDIPTGISGFGARHRAYVKVQDGCLLRCSFCIIPLVRPTMSSRPMPQIIEEVGRLLDNGYREIVLTGIHLGHYGVDFNRGRPKEQWTRLSHLLETIVKLPGDFRVRLSSIEVCEVTRELVRVMAEHGEKICPHLHISMQSGSDRVLMRMRRRWGIRRFVDRCDFVRSALDHPAFTTDVIVGFPGETESDFQATCQAARDVGFSKIHIFPFSPRQSTPAAEMPDQIPKPLRNERRARLAEVEQELRSAYFESLRGCRLRVLVESSVEASPGQVQGTSCRYAPVEMPLRRLSNNLSSPPPEVFGQFADVIAGDQLNGRIQAEM